MCLAAKAEATIASTTSLDMNPSTILHAMIVPCPTACS
jgi:hypothetical protein